MRDEMNHNPMVVVGTPTLVAGALTIDPDQALALSGPTHYVYATDSPSLSVTGSLSVEMFLRLTAYPGTWQDVVDKTSSYNIAVSPSGQIAWTLLNGANTVVVGSNVLLALNTWYHIVCVYNGEYAGGNAFGAGSTGATTLGLEDDNGNNKVVSKYTLVETALLRNVHVLMGYTDEIWGVNACGVVYADNAGVPGDLVAASGVSYLYPPNPPHKSYDWVRFPLSAAVPAGDYHIGCVTDTVGPSGKIAIFAKRDTTGGTTSWRNDSVSGPSDPFGAVTVSSTDSITMYCDYTAVSRTGQEGKALIYINGALNTSAVYSGGVADTANALQITPSMAAQVDELSVWNRALSPVQIATHYNAH